MTALSLPPAASAVSSSSGGGGGGGSGSGGGSTRMTTATATATTTATTMAAATTLATRPRDPLSPTAPPSPPALPLLVFTAAPATGHMMPLVCIARELVRRGYEAIFMTTAEFRGSVEGAGAEWFETSGFWPPGWMAERQRVPVSYARLPLDFENIFVNAMPSRAASMRALLEMLHRRDPLRELVVVYGTFTMSVLPFLHGAPLPRGYARFPPTIGININPLLAMSADTGPFGLGLLPDASESGRQRNTWLNHYARTSYFRGPNLRFRQLMRDLGAADYDPSTFVLDAWLTSCDVTFQMCSPSMEYPRSDLHPSIRFAGLLPKQPPSSSASSHPLPSWWPELLANSALPSSSPARRRVVLVCQGTVSVNLGELVLPTIEAFARRPDILLIVLLGKKGAVLPPDVKIPSFPSSSTTASSNAAAAAAAAASVNAPRVADYLPYDQALEHTDVFVNNGGYGAQAHSLANGVPMVMSGESEDHFEVAARAEWGGWAVNLRKQCPSPAALRDGVDKVLADPGYRRRAQRLQRENQDLDCIGIIERQIRAFSGAGGGARGGGGGGGDGVKS